MTAGTLVLAAICGGVFAASGVTVALVLKRAFFRSWSGSDAVVATVLLWICWALALGQLLGAVGLLRRGALLVSAVASAGVAAGASRRRGPAPVAPPVSSSLVTAPAAVPADSPAAMPGALAASPGGVVTAPGGVVTLHDRVAAAAGGVPAAAGGVPAGAGGVPAAAGGVATLHDRVAAAPGGVPAGAGGVPAVAKRGGRAAQLALVGATALLVGVVAAVWVARTAITVHRGINDPDSLGYHLAFATTFAQSGYANQHLFVLPYLPVHFYPANDELLTAIALALTHSVAFAAIKNLLFGGFILVAAHAIGTRYRAGLAAVASAAIVLGLPVIAFSQPGEAVNDALMVLVIIGGLAVLARAEKDAAPYVLAGACVGVAVGIKFSALFPAAGLGVFALALLFVRMPAHRPRWAAATTLAAVALGGSWYLRNALTYGNPVPPTKVHIGPIHLRQIATASGPKSLTVYSYLKHGELLTQFRHGLALGLGPFVALVIATWAVGALICLVVGDAFRRGVGLLALVCAFGYIVTPASAFGMAGPAHNLGAFVINIHYAAVALVVGMIAFALVIGRTRMAWLLPAFGVFVAATAIRPGQRIAYWSPEMGAAGFRCLVAAAVLGALAAVVFEWQSWRSPQAGLGTSVRSGILVLAAVVSLVGVVLAARRYPAAVATDPVQRWAARTPGATVAAWVPDIALLYGPGSANRVTTLTELADHAPVPLGSCPAWMATVIAGHFGYSAAIPGTVWDHWLASDPAFKLVAKDEVAAVYQVVAQPNLSCPGQQ